MWFSFITLAAFPSPAQNTSFPLGSARSTSDQFISQDQRRHGPSLLALALSTNASFVPLDPVLLAVSCERIKKQLNLQLETSTQWRGKIFLVLHTAESQDEAITITSERFRDRWQYRVDLPDLTERARYVRAIVQVLLLEMANRNGPERSAELPLWLTEGLSRRLLASSELEIILQPPDRKANGIPISSTSFDSRRQNPLHAQRDEPLARARMILRSHPFLSFEQLSWPAEDQLAGDEADVFCCSAQLFVAELLQLKGGKSSLAQMLVELPQFYNWQLAFLRAFHSNFADALHVEKWWTLQWVNFTGVEATQTWPLAESWQKLDEALHPSVQMRTGPNEIPSRTNATLQTIIRDWDAETQKKTLESTLGEYQLLRFRLDPRVVPFLDEYRQVLQSFLQHTEHPGLTAVLRKKAAVKHTREDTIQQLDFLDARRLASQPKPERLANANRAPATP